MSEQKGKNGDEEIIEGIKSHDRKILTEVYRQYFPMINALVTNEGGSEDDAWDVFQEGLGAIYDRIVSDGEPFELHSSFATFFYAVCKHVWHKHLRWRKNNERYLQFAKGDPVVNELEMIEKLIAENIMFNLFRRNIEKLKHDCRRLIEATINGLKTEELIALTRLGSSQAVYNKRRTCIERLFNLIKTDPDYLILKDYEKP